MEPNPEVEREHVLDRYGPLRRDRVVEFGSQVAQDTPVGELRQPPLDRVVEGQQTVLYQQRGRHAGDRLGYGRDAEDGVAADWLRVAEGLVPDGLHVHVATSSYEGH